jgi:hypothetical protein
MEDYKNQKWWIELQKSLENFDDSKMSDSDLGRWNGTLIGGRKGGSKNKESGHMSKLGKLNGKKNASHPNSIAAAKINGQKNVENKFWEKLTFEQRSIGGKIAGVKRSKMDDWKDMASIGGKQSAINRVNRKIEKYKEILNLIPNDEFTTSDAKLACKQYGYNDWMKFLKETSLIKQIYKGNNQFNPSIYKKIIP